MESKIWHLHVDFMTGSVFDRIFIGYVVADTYESAIAKKEEWAKTHDPIEFIRSKKYSNRAYDDYAVSSKNIKRANFHCHGLASKSFSFPLTEDDIIIV